MGADGSLGRRSFEKVAPSPVRRTVPLLLALLFASAVHAQELNCSVSINRSQLNGDEFAFLDDLREDVSRYVNDRAWTEDVFQDRERIDCSMQIILNAAEGLSIFTGEIVVRASRPIYGSAQPTQLLLVSDNDWAFTYTRGQSLVFDPETYNSFTSVLDFYALLILGYDYDSFASLGGTPHFELARRIAERARSNSGSQGWGAEFGEERSRYDLIRELLDPAFLPLRRAHYTYHFEVLDQFLLGPDAAWERATVILEELHELFLQFNARRYATDVFFTAKYQELASLLSEAPQRSEAYSLLSEMDPVHLSEYDKLVSGR